MGRKASSKARTHQKLLQDLENTQQAATAAYLVEQKRKRAWDEGKRPAGLWVIAEQFGVGYGALGNHVKGGKTKMESANGRSSLNHTKALTLINFTIGMADRGFPLTHEALASYALEIKCIQDPDAKKFGLVGPRNPSTSMMTTSPQNGVQHFTLSMHLQ